MTPTLLAPAATSSSEYRRSVQTSASSNPSVLPTQAPTQDCPAAACSRRSLTSLPAGYRNSHSGEVASSAQKPPVRVG